MPGLCGGNELFGGVETARYIGTLGNMPILTERATEIAAGKTRRKYFRTRPEMIEGLFFNGVDREAGNEPVKGNVRLPIPVKPSYPATAFFAGNEKTVSRTEAAMFLLFRQ